MLSAIFKNPVCYSWGFLFFFLGCFCELEAQKVTRKTWEATPFEVLEVVSKETYQLNIITSQREDILVTMEAEGEHSEEVVLEVSIKGDTLALKTAFRPYFQTENDKLAAHKVISIKLILEIPERLRVFVQALKGHVLTQGTFKSLQLDLKRGNAQLEAFYGNAWLRTWEGDIKVWAQSQVFGKGISKYGTVTNQLPTGGMPNILAESVNGDISLYKSPD